LVGGRADTSILYHKKKLTIIGIYIAEKVGQIKAESVDG
jgi:hypothetical protein